MFLIKGGFINYPTFIDMGPEFKSCSINDRSLEETILVNNEYNKLIPLFQLREYIKNTCKITHFVIDDVENNHILFEPLTVVDSVSVHHFKLTSEMQIQYLGTKTVLEYKSFDKQIFDFDKFLENNYNIVPVHKQTLMKAYFYLNNDLLVNLFKRSDKEFYLDDGSQIKILMTDLRNFLKEIYAVDMNNNIIYHNNFNIINIFIFMNKLDVLYDILDKSHKNILQYKLKIDNEIQEKIEYSDKVKTFAGNYNTIFKIKDVDGLFTNIGGMLDTIPEEDQITFLDNLDYLQELEPLKKYRETLKNEYNSTDNLDNRYSNILNLRNLKKIKNNIKKKDGKVEKILSYENIEILIFTISLIRELFTNGKLNKDAVINTFNYVVIGTEYLKFNRLTDGEQKNDTIVKINTYVKKSKPYLYLEFIKYIYLFIKNIYLIKNEFVANNIEDYNEHIKIIIGIVYYNFLKKNSSLLPISLYTHSKTFRTSFLEIIPKLELNYFRSIPFYIHNYKSCVIEDKRFMNCGETTLLNFIKYLLYDDANEKITIETISTLNRKFPKNILKDIFNKPLGIKTRKEQDVILENNINKFIQLFSFKNALEPTLYLRQEGTKIFEVEPTLLNFAKILRKLLGIKYKLKNNTNAINMFKDISSKFGEAKNPTEISINHIKYKHINFSFDESHSEANFNIDIDNNLDNIDDKYNKHNIVFLNNYNNTSYLFRSKNIYILKKSMEELKDVFTAHSRRIEFIDTLLNLKDIKIICNTSVYLKYLKYVRDTIKELYFSKNFNEQILVNINNVEKITFGDYFNKQIIPDTLNSVTTLTFGNNFNQQILPDTLNNVTTLTFGSNFNQEILPNTLNNVTTLTFGFEFNKPILPNTLNNVTTLTFGNNFDQQIIPNTLNKVKTLNFGFEFNKPIFPNTLNNVTTLTFGFEFNKPIFPNTLNNVTTITFGLEFNKPIFPNTLNNVTTITFGDNFDQQIIPNTLNNVTTLTFGSEFNQQILPDTLNNVTTLTFGSEFNQQILPNTLNSVETLTFHYFNTKSYFNEPINGTALTNLKRIIIEEENIMEKENTISSKVIYDLENKIFNNTEHTFINNLENRIKQYPELTGGYYYKYIKYKQKYLKLKELSS